ncbi:unnamed protein product [Sphagnum balticum]
MALMMKIDAKSRIDLLNNIKRVIVRQGVLRRQCSTNRAKLANVDSENEVRICDQCYDGMTLNKTRDIPQDSHYGSYKQGVEFIFGASTKQSYAANSANSSRNMDVIGGVPVAGSESYYTAIDDLVSQAHHESFSHRRNTDRMVT